jgi:hypothetical protein
MQFTIGVHIHLSQAYIFACERLWRYNVLLCIGEHTERNSAVHVKVKL